MFSGKVARAATRHAPTNLDENDSPWHSLPMQNFLRKWHRWIGFPASLFLLFASVTGFILAFTELFGADEALREKNRTLVSPVTLQSPAAQWSDPLTRNTKQPPSTASTALYEKATDVPKAVHSNPTMMLDAKSPMPLTVASVPNAMP